MIGCGYLGRQVACAWIARGLTVAALTRSHDKQQLLQEDGISSILGDILQPNSLASLPAAKIILYAVAPDATSDHPRDEVVLKGLQNVLAATRGRCDRFIFVSSTSVYGQSSGEWVDETSPCEPETMAGQLAVKAEALARREDATSIVRLSGIYGPNRLLTRVETLRNRIPLSGSPDAWLNLIHVEDAVLAIVVHAAHSDPCPTVLVSDGQPCRRMEYYELLAVLTGTPAPVFDCTKPPVRGSGGLNKRCQNRLLQTHYKVGLKYPSYREGLLALFPQQSAQHSSR